jgi:ParB family chromosome partitioning protein
MTTKRGGLGRNLSALLSQDGVMTQHPRTENLLKLAVHALQPGKYQPRGGMDESALAELADSIKKQGLLQPIVVREISLGLYEIVAGERRWRACQMAGMQEIPVIVRQVDDEMAMAMGLVENLQREDLNAMDQARAMHRLTTEFMLTHQQVSELVCKSRAAVSNYLRLLNLNSDVMRLLEHGDIEMGHARTLLILDEQTQSQVAQLVVAKNLSVRETEALAARVKSGASFEKSRPVQQELPLHQVQNLQTLARHWQTKVRIKKGKTGGGSLIIDYKDEKMLEEMMHQLGRDVNSFV